MSDYSYDQLVKKLEKVNVMLEGETPGSKKHGKLLKKRDEYSDAIAKTKEYKIAQEEKKKTQKKLEREQQTVEISEEFQVKKQKQKSEYSYDQLVKKLELAEKMMKDEKPGSKKYKKLEKKVNEYTVAIEETTEHKSKMQKERIQKLREAYKEKEQLRREESDRRLQRVAASTGTMIQQDEQTPEEKKDDDNTDSLDDHRLCEEEEDKLEVNEDIVVSEGASNVLNALMSAGRDAARKKRSSHLRAENIRVSFADDEKYCCNDDGFAGEGKNQSDDHNKLISVQEFDPDWCVMSITKPELGEGEDYDQVWWEDEDEDDDGIGWWDLEDMPEDEVTALCKKVLAKGDFEMTQQRVDRIQGNVLKFALKLKQVTSRGA